MEDNTQPAAEQPEDILADVLCFAEMFERLSPEAKAEVLELLRQLNGIS